MMPVAVLSTLATSVAVYYGKLKHAPTEPRYMRQGRAMTQMFMVWIT